MEENKLAEWDLLSDYEKDEEYQEAIAEIDDLHTEAARACHALLDYMEDGNDYVANHPEIFGDFVKRINEICEKIDDFWG